MRLLEAARQVADAECRHDLLGQLDRPVLALDVVGRFLGPELHDGVDGFHQPLIADGGIGVAEYLMVARQPGGAEAEDEAPAAHMVELRRFRRNDDRMMVGQADDSRAEVQVLRAMDE